MPRPPWRLSPERSPGGSRNCALASTRIPNAPSSSPPAAVAAKRPCPPGRRAIPTPTPRNDRCASTGAAPTAASVAVSCCPGAPRTPARARAAAPASVLAKRDVVGDARVGRERRDHGAVLLEREIDGSARLHLVRAVARDGEVEVDRRIAPRLRLAPRPPDGDLELAERDALPLLDQHNVGRRAGRHRVQQQLTGRGGRD